MVSVASCQNYAWRGLAWDYDFSSYPDSSIHVIIYHKASTDTGFYAYDTTEANAVEYDLLQHRPFYNFTTRSFYATAIQYGGPDFDNPLDSLFSFESASSDTVKAYFRALPPESIDGGVQFRTINIKDIPDL